MTQGIEKERIHTENLLNIRQYRMAPSPCFLDPSEKSVPFHCPQQCCEVVQNNLMIPSQLLKKLTPARTRTVVELAEALVHGIFETEHDRQEKMDCGELVFHWQRCALVTYYLVSTFKSVWTNAWNSIYPLVPFGLCLYLALGDCYPVKVLDSKCLIFSLSY